MRSHSTCGYGEISFLCEHYDCTSKPLLNSYLMIGDGMVMESDGDG